MARNREKPRSGSRAGARAGISLRPSAAAAGTERVVGSAVEAVRASGEAAELVAGVLPDGGLAGLVAALEGATVRKESTVRTVVRGVLRGSSADGSQRALDVHLKTHRAARWTDRTRDLVRGPRGVREFENLLEAHDRGVPAIEPLAAGKATDLDGVACSFVVTATAGRSEPLTRARKSVWPEGDASPFEVQALVAWPEATCAAVGALLARAHEAGLHARDLHPENVLVSAGSGESAPEALLCDLTSVLWGEALERAERAHALAFFCLDFDGLVHDPAVRPLLDAYGADRPLIDLAARKALRLRQRALRRFGERAFRACRDTAVERRGSLRWSVCRGAPEALVERARALGDQPDETDATTRVLKTGRRGSVALHGPLVVKQRAPSKARALFEAAYWLRFAGVPCALPVALRTERKDDDRPRGAEGGVVFSARIERGSSGGDSAPDWSDDLWTACAAGRVDEASAAVLARDLGRSVGRLHGFGLRCRDLKFENLVLSGEQLVLVDLDGVQRNADVADARGQAADLGRLRAAWSADTGRGPGEPGLGGMRTARAFWRAYRSERARLLTPVVRRDLRALAAVRASGWWSEHPGTEPPPDRLVRGREAASSKRSAAG